MSHRGPRTAPSSSFAAAEKWKQRWWAGTPSQVPWPFEPLSSGENASLRVRVSGSGDTVSDWSEPLRIRAGFLEPGGWAATPIGRAEPSEEAQPGLARTEFNIGGEVRQALLYATALGAYQVSINGTDVDDHVLKPRRAAAGQRYLRGRGL